MCIKWVMISHIHLYCVFCCVSYSFSFFRFVVEWWFYLGHYYSVHNLLGASLPSFLDQCRFYKPHQVGVHWLGLSDCSFWTLLYGFSRIGIRHFPKHQCQCGTKFHHYVICCYEIRTGGFGVHHHQFCCSVGTRSTSLDLWRVLCHLCHSCGHSLLCSLPYIQFCLWWWLHCVCW